MTLCECGCGTELPSTVRRTQRFLAGHGARAPRKPRVEASCRHCEAVFSGTAKAMEGRTFCSAACRDQFRKANTGPASPSYRRIDLACSICGTNFSTPPARLKNHQVYCSMACGREGRRRKISGRARSTQPIGKHKAKVRDGFACRICGFDLFVHAHHIVHKKNGGTNALTNLISLCPNHHAMAHAELLTADTMRAAIAQPLPASLGLVVKAKHAVNYRAS